jgi:tripartite ATP-independent transporter DctP family solute receptor
MKRRTFAALAAFAGLSVLAAGPLSTSASAQTKLKWGHVYETSEAFHVEALWAAGEIAKRTNNKYQVEVFPASQLGKETDINQGLSLGSVDMIYTGSSFAARSYPPMGVTYYPFTFRDSDHLLAFSKSDVFQEFSKGYEEKTGHKITATTYYGVRHTSTNRAFKTCAEMKGLKIRVPDVPAYLAMPRSCGANTTPIAFAEVYLALQNGTVEAQENPLTTIEAKKFYEVQKHIVLTGHIVDQLNTIFAKSTWAKFSDDEKKIFTDVTQEAAARATARVKADEAKLVQFFKDKGLTVTEIDRKEFLDNVNKAVTFEQFGYKKSDWERIQAIKSGSGT